MTDSISFSFVLPAFKSEYLKKSIDSILAQTYPDFELIIVNDASPHPIDKIVASYQSDKIRYYKNPHNIGGADLVKNWNHCLHYAKGEYVILASDDDIYEKDFLLTASRIVMKHPTVDVVRSRVVKIDESDLIIEQNTLWMRY
jgi:glycosyltransferase involved in cell wall biosynthesis